MGTLPRMNFHLWEQTDEALDPSHLIDPHTRHISGWYRKRYPCIFVKISLMCCVVMAGCKGMTVGMGKRNAPTLSFAGRDHLHNLPVQHRHRNERPIGGDFGRIFEKPGSHPQRVL